jgi:FMN phosphatase YigB (HAD superfamily)
MIRDGYAFLPGIERLLAELAAIQRTGAALSVHALSNYPEWYVWIENKLRLSRFLEWSFVSCQVGLRKPDPKLYEHVLRTLDAAPEDCLFVDDRQKNLDPAAALGMRTHLFQGADRLREALVAEGILPAPTV